MKHSLEDNDSGCKRQRNDSKPVFLIPVQPGVPFQLPNEIPAQPQIAELKIYRLYNGKYPFNIDIPVIKGDFNILNGLEPEIIDVLDVLDILGVDSIRESVKQLTLEIRRPETVHFIQSLGSFPNLTKLTVKHTATVPNPIPDLKAPNVREIEVIAIKRELPFGWERAFDQLELPIPSLPEQDQTANIDMISRNCPNVEKLFINEVQTRQVADPIEKMLPNLRTLYIRYSVKLDWFRFSQKFFNCYMPSLQEFKLDLFDNCGTCYITHMLAPNLRYVDVDIYENNFASFLNHLVLSNLNNLETLKIGNVTELHIQDPMGPSIREILIFNTTKSPLKLIQGGELSNLKLLKYLKKTENNVEMLGYVNPGCVRDIWVGEERWIG